MKKILLLSLALLPLWLFAQVPTRPTPAQLQQAAANTNDVLTWNGSAWAPAAPSGTTNLTYTGASSPVTLNSSTGSDVTIVQGGIIALSATGTELTISATEVDGSTSNELQTFGHAGTTSYTNTLSNGGGSFTLQASGIASISHTAGTVTISATEVDGSVSNELQTVSNSSDATSHTVTLSNSGGSLQLVEGSNITLTTSGTGLNGVVTIAAAGGGSTDLAYTGTSSPVTLNSSTGTDVTFVQGGIVSLSATGTELTISATEVDGSTSNELQTFGHAGTTSYTNTLSNGGGSFTLQASGIAAISHTAGTVTISATEVDGSVSNEGSLSVVAGGSNDSQIQSNTSGSTNITIAGGTNVTVTESGSTITISASGGGGGPTVVLKTADESVTSSTTFQADDHLTFTCPANKKCAFNGYLFVTNMQTAEIKVRTVASGATTVRMIGGGGATDYRYMYNQASTLGQIQTNEETGATHEDGGVDFAGYVLPGTSDRTVVIEWAQKTSTAKATTVQAGSFLRYDVID